MYRQALPLELAAAFEKIRLERNLRQGVLSRLKGQLAEERVFRAAIGLCETYDWIFAARPANRKEDGRGIDIVVYSEWGKLYLQVKSSHSGARRYRDKRPTAKTMVVIVDPDMDDVKVRNKTYEALCRLRRYFQKQRK